MRRVAAFSALVAAFAWRAGIRDGGGSVLSSEDARGRARRTANYDEAKANPTPRCPDALVLKNGKRVTSAKDVVG